MHPARHPSRPQPSVRPGPTRHGGVDTAAGTGTASSPGDQPAGGRRLVVGVDAGGTATRALLADDHGRVHGRGGAGGANLRSSPGPPAEAIAAALRQALAGHDPAAVGAGALGMAGAGAAGRDRAEAAARAAWEVAGLPGEPVVVEDVVVAFAAGCPDPAGLVLVAGTGAIAAAVEGGQVRRRADGCGWLLGDEGSAVWLGVRAARAALAARDGRGPATGLTGLVAAELLGGPGPADPAAWVQAVIAAVDRLHPAELGRLAPLVGAAAGAGDAVAADLTRAAAGRLLATLAAVAGGSPPPAVVLAGGLLAPGALVGELVTAGLAAAWPHARRLRAGAGEAGAAWLALRAMAGGRWPDPAVHQRLVTPAPPLPAGPPEAMARRRAGR